MKKQGTLIPTDQGWVLVNGEKISTWYIDSCNNLRLSFTDDEDYYEVRMDYRNVIAAELRKGFLYTLDKKQIEEQIEAIANLRSKFFPESIYRPKEYLVEYEELEYFDDNDLSIGFKPKTTNSYLHINIIK